MFNLKPIICPLSLVSVVAVLPFSPGLTYSANACAIVDATTQVALHQSPTPADQQNTVNTASDDNCLGNAVVGTTTQVGVGHESQQQINQGDYFVGGGDINQYGVTSPLIEVTPETQIDMQIPGYQY
ncbi:hypothetical protein [Pleurocapsa sp. PCC 7319]|uniref:hypothetical protein n=1 Tax=Pleurocapsa sp. PCC 7319 TaxID=118161 RepID=UPI000346C007|nr:hypothetical protein [Pleurocapsa sp. PCC 7319]